MDRWMNSKFIDPVKIRVDVPNDQLPKLIEELQNREDVIRKQFKVYFPFERAHEYQHKIPSREYEFGVITITPKKDLIVFPYNNIRNRLAIDMYIVLNRLDDLSLKPILFKPFMSDLPEDKKPCIIYAFEIRHR